MNEISIGVSYICHLICYNFILGFDSVPQELNRPFFGQSCGLDKHNLSYGTKDAGIGHVKNSMEIKIGKRSVNIEVRTT